MSFVLDHAVLELPDSGMFLADAEKSKSELGREIGAQTDLASPGIRVIKEAMGVL